MGWTGDRLTHRLYAPDGTSGATVRVDGLEWEVRRLMAQVLWLRTHTILHAGVEDRAARPGEESSRAAEVHHHATTPTRDSDDNDHAARSEAPNAENSEPEDEHDHGDAQVLTIPPAHEDFRGVLGDLERAVKPYKLSSGALPSKDADQTIPLFRFMTRLDPHFIPGFVVGASMIYRGGRFPDAAIDLLAEGAVANPESFEVQVELGRLFLVAKKDLPRAETHLRRALELAPIARPRTELEEDALADAYRWLGLTYREARKPREAVAVAREGLRVFPGDVTLTHLVERDGA
jgi:tetratricopeptide (TPR) repeat protein